MDEHEFNEVVREMESVEGFMFPDNTLGKVLNSWKDTFSGLDLLTQQSTAS